MSVLLCCCLFVSVLSLNVSAAEVDGFYSRNMVHKAYILQNVDNVLTPFDYTDHLTVSNGTYVGKNCTLYSLPSISTSNIRYVSSYQIEELNASHEYHIKFQSSSNIVSETNMCLVSLVFYNGDEILRTQNLGGCNFPNDQWQEVEFDFVPDTSGLGGYKTRIEFQFISYSNTNSVTYRLSDFIEFEDKDDNAGWFQKIINAIKEIPEKIGDLRDNISNYFSALGDRITAKFESVGTSITNKFEEVKNAIGSWFTEIGDKLSNKFAEVGNAITSKFAEIGAEFSATFDTFKPRLYEVFEWRYGMSTGSEIIYDYEDYGSAVISNEFYIPTGTNYIFDVDTSKIDDNDFWIYQVSVYYFSDENTLSYLVSDSLDVFIYAYPNGFELESGRSYYFEICTNSWEPFGTYFPNQDLSDICNSIVKVYADEGWLTAFGRMILNGLKNFFIPSPDYFDTYSETTKTWASEHFGFLYTAADLFSSVVEDLKGLLRDDYSFKIPPAKFTLMGTEYTLWEEYEVPMKEYLKNSALNFAYNTYLVMLSGALSFALLEYARKTYDKIMAN